jgi:diguanylate cyclase (GGDEF)-like protein
MIFYISSVFVITLVMSAWVIDKAYKYIRELKGVRDKLRKLAITDGLTDTYNHRYFELTLEREWKRMQRLHHPLGCIMIDFDNFKQVNDCYGHPTGDTVLRLTAKLLKMEFREIDIVSRYGGEEFVVILVEKPAHLDGLTRTMERIRKKIAEQRFSFQGKEFSITASIGGALVPHPEINTPEDLVRASDQAMYCAKRINKNCSKTFITNKSDKTCCR